MGKLALFLLAAGGLDWQAQDGRITLVENGKPVLVYNEGVQLPPGVPEDRARCCYVHPIYTPAGVAVTDDFPKDHYHHRGLFWAWPVVKVDGQAYDLWMKMKDIRHRPVSAKTAGNRLTAVNEWIAGDRPIVREQVTITAHPAQGSAREFDLALRLEALGKSVTLAGAPDRGKSYGGLNVRFAPRTATVIRTESGVLPKDEDLNPRQWAELEATYEGRRAVLRITPDSANPGAPHQWCLREYGFIGASFPGKTEQVQDDILESGSPLVLKYRIRVADVK